MITICEPLCKGISHEKVNSGFIYGLSLAFPGEKIRFYANATHIEAIKNILEHDKVIINQIEYKPIRIFELLSLFNVAMYYFIFLQMFIDVLKAGNYKIYFLSFTPESLYAIKKLKKITKFSHFKFASVLHGAFETIADDFPLPRAIILPRNSIPDSANRTLLKKIIRIKPSRIPMLIFRKMITKLPRLPSPKRLSEFFSVKHMMKWEHSADFRFITLSYHVTRNAARYMNVEEFDLYTIILPTIFVPPSEPPANEYVKFAIFGYGDSLILHNLAYSLTQKNIKKPYEIRIIGMDDRGTQNMMNITCTSNGKRLERAEMESQASDVDAFLILYDKTKYRLSCSGSILESLSMVKPVIHFDNDCINEFNTIENPIGFCCDSFDEYVSKLQDIIENYDAYKLTFLDFRGNILKQRDECSIEKALPQIRDSFSW